MTKILLMLSLINASVNTSYSNIDSIEYMQTNSDKKQIAFNFNTDYSNTHRFLVFIDIYKNDGSLLKSYSNEIIVIGEKKAFANIEYCNGNEDYFLINVIYDNNKVVEDAKLIMYKQEDCYLNQENLECARIYKSEYYKDISKDSLTNFRVTKNIFNKFLSSNILDLANVSIYSDYDFGESNAYFIINDKIEGYDIFYNNGYLILLGIEDNKFYILEDYYVDVLNFKYSEKYFENSNKTKKIHFPYQLEYKEYNCKIVIETFINIEIDFLLSTSEQLFGECSDSKFCIVGEAYD